VKSSDLIELSLQTFMSIVVGSLVAITAYFFVNGARQLLSLTDQSTALTFSMAGMDFSAMPVASMLLAACLIIIVRRAFGVTKWSGPADSIYALQQSKVGVDIRAGIASTLAAFISASGGASVGQYGPLVHFGATISTLLTKFSGRFIRSDVLIACGVAAAISSGFNAPIAGIVFAHEALLRRFSISAVAPISVASITAAAVNGYFFDSNLAFSVPAGSPELSTVLPFVILAAPFCCAAAIGYMVALRFAQRFSAQSSLSFSTLILITALAVGLVGIFVPEVLGLGGEEINKILGASYAPSYLLVILLLKVAVTAACIGFGFFGGVFGPALFIGATVGGLLASVLVYLGLPNDYVGIIAISTLAAVGSAVIGAPITMVLIVVELTGSYEFGLMALLSVTLCNALTYRTFGLSFFDRQLLDRGIDLRRGREYIHMTQVKVREIPTSHFLKFGIVTPKQEIIETFIDENMTEAYFVDEDENLIGKISITDLMIEDDFLKKIDYAPTSFDADCSLTEALSIATSFVGESIPIVHQGKLVGAITEGDLFSEVLAIQDRIRQES